MILFRDKQGEPLTVERWAELFGDNSYRVVAHYAELEVAKIDVSTIWLGATYPEGELFETRVRGFDILINSWRSMFTRWPNEATALDFHGEFVELAKTEPGAVHDILRLDNWREVDHG